jgi:hypothetical protein
MLSRLDLSYGCRRPTVGRGLHDQVDSSDFAELAVVRVIEIYAKTVFEVLIRTAILFLPECAYQGRNVDERSSPETDVRWALSRRPAASHCNCVARVGWPKSPGGSGAELLLMAAKSWLLVVLQSC